MCFSKDKTIHRKSSKIMSYIVWVGGIADSPYHTMEAAVRAKTDWEARGFDDVTIQAGRDNKSTEVTEQE